MNITLWNPVVAKLSKTMQERCGIRDWKDQHWVKKHVVVLANMKPGYVQDLIDDLTPLLKDSELKGVKSALADAKTWLAVLNGKEVKCRTAQTFESLGDQFCSQAYERNIAEGRPPGVRIYKREDDHSVYTSYAIVELEFTPEEQSHGYTHPAHTDVTLVWKEFGGEHKKAIRFEFGDVNGKTVSEAFALKGYQFETAELRTQYEVNVATFVSWSEQVGRQFWAYGWANDDCDGNTKGRESSWYWRNVKRINLEKEGEPSRVVMDVFFEDDENEKRGEKHVSISKAYWQRLLEGVKKDDEEDKENSGVMAYEDIPEPEIPLHTAVACYDLRRHMRLRLDIGQLKPYEYDKQLGKKLVLPADSRALVDMLMSNNSMFTDVVRGKSGGSIILCAGEPGTGKTLTAEVYSEVMGKPLFSVQASQLGTSPDALEEELLKTFARSSRWGSILLLDECDVYVRSRGEDLTQNAIVGVFLRVLEYYPGLMFLTTNRADLVDDAIASRCVARIQYGAPGIEDQKKIWRILSATSGIPVHEDVLTQVAEAFPDLSGRDVKNLLKLARLVAESRKCEITLDVIKFVKRFKPTGVAYAPDEDVVLPPALPRVVRAPVKA